MQYRMCLNMFLFKGTKSGRRSWKCIQTACCSWFINADWPLQQRKLSLTFNVWEKSNLCSCSIRLTQRERDYSRNREREKHKWKDALWRNFTRALCSAAQHKTKEQQSVIFHKWTFLFCSVVSCLFFWLLMAHSSLKGLCGVFLLTNKVMFTLTYLLKCIVCFLVV